MTKDRALSAAISEAVEGVDPELSARLAAGEDVYADVIGLAADAHEETKRILQLTVDSARRAGYSWEAVGQILGVSKQAAQQKYGGQSAAKNEASETGLSRLYPVNVFNEITMLNEAGLYGWRSVGFGVRFHWIQPSDEQWEHTRVISTSGNIREIEKDGWQIIGAATFPWAYFSRLKNTPALASQPGNGLRKIIVDSTP